MLRSIKITCFLLLLYQIRSTAAVTTQFQQWYPEFGFIFDRILHENCSAEFATYLTMKKSDAPIEIWTGGSKTSRLAQPVVNCILNYTSEFIKSNMASAAVLLGLTPTILATVGNSVEETSTLFIIARRPLLALCLAAGSPAVSPVRSFKYLDPWNLLKERDYRLRPMKFSTRGENAIVVLEYILAIAIIANTVSLCSQLGLRVSCTFAPHLTYLPLLWTILGISIHISGAAALWVRTTAMRKRSCASTFQLLRQQFKPLDRHIASDMEFEDESYLYICFSWFTSLLSMCHLIYGTLAFSSMLFISVRDSLTVIARYMASAICCRVILMYKLSLLRDFTNAEKDIVVEPHRRTLLTDHEVSC
jgi:hypothetical protein